MSPNHLLQSLPSEQGMQRVQCESASVLDDLTRRMCNLFKNQVQEVVLLWRKQRPQFRLMTLQGLRVATLTRHLVVITNTICVNIPPLKSNELIQWTTIDTTTMSTSRLRQAQHLKMAAANAHSSVSAPNNKLCILQQAVRQTGLKHTVKPTNCHSWKYKLLLIILRAIQRHFMSNLFN